MHFEGCELFNHSSYRYGLFKRRKIYAYTSLTVLLKRQILKGVTISVFTKCTVTTELHDTMLNCMRKKNFSYQQKLNNSGLFFCVEAFKTLEKMDL